MLVPPPWTSLSTTWILQEADTMKFRVQEVYWGGGGREAWGRGTLVKDCYCCSVNKSCPILCNPMDCSMPGFHVLHCLPEFAQTHVHWVSDAIQPSHPLSPPSLPALNLSQHQGLFQWAGSSHQVAKLMELQCQSFQWIFRVDFL